MLRKFAGQNVLPNNYFSLFPRDEGGTGRRPCMSSCWTQKGMKESQLPLKF